MKIYIITGCHEEEGEPLKCFVNKNKAINFLKNADLKDLCPYYDGRQIKYKEFQETPDSEYQIAYANFDYEDTWLDPYTGEEVAALVFSLVEMKTED